MRCIESECDAVVSPSSFQYRPLMWIVAGYLPLLGNEQRGMRGFGLMLEDILKARPVMDALEAQIFPTRGVLIEVKT